MFQDTSVTISDDPRFSLLIFTISRNKTFLIPVALTVPVATTPIVLKCISKAGLVKNCPWQCNHWRSASQEFSWPILQLLTHQDLVLSFHTPAELNPYQSMSKTGYNILMTLPYAQFKPKLYPVGTQRPKDVPLWAYLVETSWTIIVPKWDVLGF